MLQSWKVFDDWTASDTVVSHSELTMEDHSKELAYCFRCLFSSLSVTLHPSAGDLWAAKTVQSRPSYIKFSLSLRTAGGVGGDVFNLASAIFKFFLLLFFSFSFVFVCFFLLCVALFYKSPGQRNYRYNTNFWAVIYRLSDWGRRQLEQGLGWAGLSSFLHPATTPISISVRRSSSAATHRWRCRSWKPSGWYISSLVFQL